MCFSFLIESELAGSWRPSSLANHTRHPFRQGPAVGGIHFPLLNTDPASSVLFDFSSVKVSVVGRVGSIEDKATDEKFVI